MHDVVSLWRRLGIAGGLFALLLPGLAFAQAERDTTHRPPALQKGGWGFQYQMTSLNALLSGFQGSLISARYHFSDRQVLRVGVSVRGSFENRDESESRRTDRAGSDDPEDETIHERTLDSGSQIYGLSGQYLTYFEPAERVFVFAGVGPQFSYNTFSDKDTSYPNPDNRDRREVTEREATEYIVGLGGTLGVEWFVHSNVSLSAEYPLSIEYTHRQQERTDRSIDEGAQVGVEETVQTVTTETDGFGFGGQSVRIGVTFSFGP